MEEDQRKQYMEESSGSSSSFMQDTSHHHHSEDTRIDPDQPPSPRTKPLSVPVGAPPQGTPIRTIHLTAPNTFTSIPSLHSFRYPTEANFIPEIANIAQDDKAAATPPIQQGKQEYSAIVPSYASWFSFDSVSDVEKKAFPDLLNPNHPTQNPELYKECRNYMVHAFRSHPIEYLTLTVCRRHLAVDVSTLFRIHSFLEQWGLINYQIDAQGRPALIQVPDTKAFTLYVEGPKGLRKHVPTAQPVSLPPSPSSSEPSASVSQPDLSLYPNVMVKKEESSSTTTQTEVSLKQVTPVYCGTCGQQCGSSYYHCIKHPPLNVCKWCFTEGRFPSSLYSGDFVKLRVSDDDSLSSSSTSITLSGCWSDQESLYLLEGVEMYHDDWDKVANHVATKTKEECILRFLELPIQDPYLFQSLQESYSLSKQSAPVPFLSSSANPIMALISFFSSTIHPSIAAEAAKTAIAEYEMSTKKKRKTSPTEESAEGGGQRHSEQMDKKTMQEAMTKIIGQSAVHARKIAEHEEDRMKGLVSVLIEAQLKKLDLKLLQVETIEKALMDERLELERQRNLLARDRFSFQEILEELNKKEEQKATLESAGASEESPGKEQQSIITPDQPPPQLFSIP